MSNTKLNHQCKVCGTLYSACDNCYNDKTFRPWSAYCDTRQHYQIYLVALDIRDNVIKNAEAKEMLTNIGVTQKDIDKLLPSIINILSGVFVKEECKVKPNVVPVKNKKIDKIELSVEPEVVEVDNKTE